MARPSRPSIAGFRERLEWLVRCIPLDPAVNGRVVSLTDLRNKIAERLDRNSGLNERTWSRYLSTGKPDKHILTALHDLYPRLRSGPDLLTCEWDQFSQLTSRTEQAFRRWRAATELFSTSRATVECVGKEVYSDLDELSGFPLIGRTAWLPDAPILITETSNELLRSTTTFDRNQSVELRLDQLNTPYATLKIASLHRKKAPPNDDCFIVKDIRNNNKEMDICFGTGKYFDYLALLWQVFG